MHFNDSIIQVLIPFFWALGFIVSPLDNWRSKVYAVLGSLTFIFYTTKLFIISIGAPIEIMRFDSTSTLVLSGLLRAEPLGVSFALLNAVTLLIVALKDQVNRDINYKRFYFQAFLLVFCTNLALLAGKMSSFIVIMELAFFQYVMILKLNPRGRLDSIVRNGLPAFSISFFLAFTVLVLRGIENDGFHPNMRIISAILLVISFGIKAGIFPFDGWMTRAIKSGASRVNILLFGCVGRLGVIGIAKFLLNEYQHELAEISSVLLWAGVIGFGLCVFRIKNTSNFLIKQAQIFTLAGPLLLIAIGLGDQNVLVGALYYIVVITLVLELLAIPNSNKQEDLNKKNNRLLGAYLCVLYGVPFVGLFVSEFSTVFSVINTNYIMGIALGVLFCIINLDVLSHMYVTYVIKKKSIVRSRNELTAVAFLFVLLFILGLFPDVLVANFQEITTNLSSK